MRTTALVYSFVAAALVATVQPDVSHAQTGHLRGIVIDQSSKQPIENARVTLMGTAFGAMTKADGTYYISAPYGTYTGMVSAQGFGSVEVPNLTVSATSGGITPKGTRTIELAASSLASTRVGTLQGQQGQQGQLGQQVSVQSMEQGVATTSRYPFPVRTFPLQNLTPEAAAKLLAPYMPMGVPVGYAGVFEAGASISAITVRAPKEVLVTVDSVLRVYDRSSSTITLRFKLIVATDSIARDPAISEIDATLRQMFRFGGYRQVAEGTTTISERSRFSMNLTSGGMDYYLSGDVGSMSGSASSPIQQLTVNLYGGPSGPGSTSGRGPGPMSRSIMSTGLSVPIGQTVVIGGATGNDGGRTLILVVRPELSSARKP